MTMGMRLIPRAAGRFEGPRFDGEPGLADRPLEDVANDAAALLKVTTGGKAYGCGQYGCAVPTSDGRVLKITVDLDEVRWAWVARQLGKPRGFVHVDVPPTILWPLEYGGRYAFGYVREEATPLGKRESRLSGRTGRSAMEALLQVQDIAHWPIPHRPAEREEWRRDYLARVAKLGKYFPAIAETASELARVGPVTYDMKPENMGRRADGEIVLFDGRIRAGVLEEHARRTARELEVVEENLARDLTQPGYLPTFRQHVDSMGGIERTTRYRSGEMTDDEWTAAWELAQASRKDPYAFFPRKDRLGNPIVTLTTLGAIFMMTPITPIAAAAGAAHAARKKKKQAS